MWVVKGNARAQPEVCTLCASLKDLHGLIFKDFEQEEPLSYLKFLGENRTDFFQKKKMM